MASTLCWVIDPMKRRAWSYERGGEPVAASEALSAADIHLPLMDVFSIVDAQPTSL